jgi:biopolymer transport protein ExbB
MYEFLAKGGPVMWPLLACSIVALGVVFERFFFWVLLTARTDQKRIGRIFSFTEAGEFEQAVKEGEETKCVVSQILSVGLAHREYGLVDCLEASAMQEIEKMKRNLSILDTIITLSPLLGILGTVTGIIASFDLLGAAGIEDPKAVTGGIAQALITTATGLAIAIVALLPYNALVQKVEKATRHLEKLISSFNITVQKGLEKRND